MFDIKNSGTGLAVSSVDVEPMTLHIDTNLIKLSHKEFEIDFDLNPDKLKNIDTIIINGYKYVKLKE
jgi:hypothetical protein